MLLFVAMQQSLNFNSIFLVSWFRIKITILFCFVVSLTCCYFCNQDVGKLKLVAMNVTKCSGSTLILRSQDLFLLH